MLLQCNQGCKLSGGTTDGSLDLDSNEVICNNCGDVLNNISSFAKRTMKSNNDIKKAKIKAFFFDCSTCRKKVDTFAKGGKLYGKDCKYKCEFNVSKFMINSMEDIQNTKYNEDDEYEDDEYEDDEYEDGDI